MINKFKINQILQCFRSAPGYSLALAQAHAGREIASLSYSLALAQAHAGREIASLSYSLALAQAHAGREIASLSYPEGEPAHTLILNLKLVNCVLAPLQGAGGSVSVLFLAIF